MTSGGGEEGTCEKCGEWTHNLSYRMKGFCMACMNKRDAGGNMKPPVYYVTDLSVTSPQHLPPVSLDQLYTGEDLVKIFKGIEKSFYANAIQFSCDDYSIMFGELR